jgi:PAS domain S-box-containing protein
VNNKKRYVPPRIIQYAPNQVFENVIRLFADDLRTPDPVGNQNVPEFLREDLLNGGAHVEPIYTTVVDRDRKYVDVSESFCELVGYKVEELIGTRYDDLTALNTANIPTTYKLFSKLGYMHGLWMLVHRTGYRILIRYEAWIRPDTNIQSNIEVLQTIL